MKHLSILIFFVLYFYSCKKQTYEHVDAVFYYPCKCCEYSDSVEGTYTGRYVEKIAYSGSQGYLYDTILDTIVSIQFQKQFLNQDFISDSLYCKFQVSGFRTGTVYISENSLMWNGYLDFDPNFFQNNYFEININGDFVMYNTTYVNRYFSYTSAYFRGIKQ